MRLGNWLRLLATTIALAVVAVSCSGRSSFVDPGDGMDASLAPSAGSAPASLRMAALRARQNAAGYDFATDVAGVSRTHAGSSAEAVDVTASEGGVRLSGAFALGIATTSIGRSDGSAGSRAVVGQRTSGQELVVTREDAVEERFLAGPLGVEQSYSLRARPQGSGLVEIRVAFDGLSPQLAHGTTDRVALRDATGRVRTWYTDLVAVDAAGRMLDARMDVRGGGVVLVLDDEGARYPVEVDPLVWTQQAELTVTSGTQPGGAGDWFGASVSMSGSIAIVGAPNHTVGANVGAGAAYVFVQSGVSWTLQQALTASDGAAGDAFGTSVSVSGATAVVGAPYHAVGAKLEAGAAYVFTQSGGTWTQQAPDLTASDGVASDDFGQSVAISGTTVIVGAPEHAVGGKGEAGAAYVFAETSGTWSQQQELTASDDHLGDQFGFSVAVSGTNAIVGAYQHDVGTVISAGAAYVFAESSGTWSQQAELTASDGAISDSFGYSVAVSGGTALVGALKHDAGAVTSAGAAYVYSQSGTTWSLQQELTASDKAAADSFGVSVAVSGGTAVVGAYQHAVGGKLQQGAAYVFTVSGTTWTQASELTASDGAAADLFGASVGASGDYAIVGAYQHLVGGNAQQGAAYVFLGSVTGGTSCYINGTSYTSGTIDPGNSCEVCTPATSTTAWSNVSNGTACNDGNECDLNDTCQSGVCTAGSHVTCTVTDTCHTPGTCSPASGTCSAPTLNAGFCFIGGACVASGAANGTNTCETCQPTVSTTAYTNVTNGTSCNDGNKCDLGDTCQTGTCTAGSHVTCTAPDSCHTAGTCNTSTGVCSAPTLNAGFCYIGGACVASGATNGTNTCETCQPAVSTTAYSNVTNGTSCSDGNACDLNDTCQSGACTVGSKVTCTAPDSCHTAGTCNTSTGVCSAPTLNAGFCFIGGACVASGATNGTNTCETCQPAVSTSAYSNVTNGTACNDGNACDLNDTCQSGACTAGSKVTCTAPDSCHTAGTCNTSTGVCSAPTLSAGFCFIGGACVASGATNGTNTCETCQPAVSTTAYSNVSNGTSCNDGNKCDLNDTCQAGACTAGSHVTCTTDSCHTAGTCNSATGVCSAPTLDPGFCFIGGACVASGATNGTNTCETCQPAVSTSQYTNATNGTACNDGNACDLNDTCQAGACTAGSHVTCTAPDSCHTAGTCNTSTGVCSAPTLSAGFCFIGGACVASGAPNGANTCETCQPGVSTSQYTNATNGTACNDGNACDLNDTCQAGVCTAGGHVTCTASDQCHVAGTCSPSTGTCSNPVATNGTTCNDGVSCTAGDVCTNGTCGGTPYTCVPTVCQATSTCNGNGQCSVTNATNGTPCGSNEVCIAGVCTNETTDAGTTPDGGGASDAGGANDGGNASDGGTARDAGGSGDGGASGDGGTSGDGGGSTDAGLNADARAPIDGSAGGDGGGGTTDAGGSEDASVTEDAGATTEDAGATTEDAGATTGEDGGGSANEDAGQGTGNLEDGGASVSEDGGDGGGTSGGVGQSPGCGCSTVGSSHEEPSLLLGVVGLVVVAARRRRRGSK